MTLLMRLNFLQDHAMPTTVKGNAELLFELDFVQ